MQKSFSKSESAWGIKMTDSARYEEVLIRHNRYPSYKRIIKEAAYIREGINPGCGDEIKVYVDIENEVIKDASFDGSICALSQTSADLMIESIIGKSVKEVIKITDTVLKASEKKGEFSPEGSPINKEDEQIGGLEIVKYYSESKALTKCTLLGWKTLYKLIKEVQ